jgi:hypothetical protein
VSGSVWAAVQAEQNMRLTNAEKADVMAIMIDEDVSLRAVQRACLYLKPRVESNRPLTPVFHDKVLDKCEMYGPLWGCSDG